MAAVEFDGVEYRLDCFNVRCEPLSIQASIQMAVVQDDERIPLARRRRDVREGNPVLMMAEFDPEMYAPGSTSISIREPENVKRLLALGDVEAIQDGLLTLAQKKELIPFQLIGFGRGNHRPKETKDNKRE